MPSVFISIIVPVFNVEKYLARCINSIINQTYQTIEIILVNDGSTDSSLSICNSFKRIDNRIIVIDKKNGGLSSARNAGLEICSGSYVSFVDSDDYIEADMIETLFYSAFNNGTLLSCCGRFDVFEKENKRQVGLCPLSNENCSSDIALSRLLTWNGIDSSACDKLFSAQLWKSERFPEGRISEDVAVMYLIFEKAGTISFVSKPLYNYCHRSKSITTSSFSSKTYDLLTNVLSIESFVLKNYMIFNFCISNLFNNYLRFRRIIFSPI